MTTHNARIRFSIFHPLTKVVTGGASIRLCKLGTSDGNYGHGTLIADPIYATRTSTTPLLNPRTLASGVYIFEMWADSPGTDLTDGFVDVEIKHTDGRQESDTVPFGSPGTGVQGPPGAPGPASVPAANALMEFDGVVWTAYSFAQGARTQVGSSAAEPSAVYNALIAAFPQAQTLVYQDMTVLAPLAPIGGSGITMLGSNYQNSATKLPQITAGTGFVGSAVILNNAGVSVNLVNCSVNANGKCTYALSTGTNGTTRVYGGDYANGTNAAINSNGSDCSYHHVDCQTGSAVGTYAFRHQTSSDLVVNGGRWSGGSLQTARIEGGTGIQVHGVHITDSNGKGNMYVASDGGQFTNLYLDTDGDDATAEACLVVSGGVNMFTNIHLRCGASNTLTGVAISAISVKGGAHAGFTDIQTETRPASGPVNFTKVCNVDGATSRASFAGACEFDAVTAVLQATAFTASGGAAVPTLRGAVWLNGVLLT